MKDLAIQFGAKLREERKRRGISQEKNCATNRDRPQLHGANRAWRGKHHARKGISVGRSLRL